jgi:hypothetical protein
MPTTEEMAAQAAAEVLLLLIVAPLFACAVAHAFVAPSSRHDRDRRAR